MQVGILAIQGSYAAHAQALKQLGIACHYITQVKHLNNTDALILPGGESTTLLQFLEETGLFSAIDDFAQTGKPVLGTCAGAILLADNVINPEQRSLGLLNITIERNAYGRQINSHVSQGSFYFDDKSHQAEMVFIRAPKILETQPTVKVIATCAQEIVGVQQDNCLALTFHPELSHDFSIYRYFLKIR